MNRPILLVVAAASIVAPAVHAQSSEADAVMAPIRTLFDGMRAGDSAAVRSVFTPNARLMRAGANGLGETPIDRFVALVGAPHDSIWNEPIWDEVVHIDGHLATVWTKYAFFLGTRFSHCGVDAFQLHRTAAGWKIFQLTDTMRSEECQMPPSMR